MIPITLNLLKGLDWVVKGSVAYRQLDSPKVRLGWKPDGTLIIGYGEWPRKVTTLHYLQQIIKLIKI